MVTCGSRRYLLEPLAVRRYINCMAIFWRLFINVVGTYASWFVSRPYTYFQTFRFTFQNKSVCYTLSPQAKAAFMFDGVYTLLNTFNRILTDRRDMFTKNIKRGEVYATSTDRMECRPTNEIIPWEHGTTIMTYLKRVGLTICQRQFQIVIISE